MTKIKGSQTERNLLKSFAGESQARTRYSFYAGVARKEGYVQIANIFEETAGHEKAHAKRFYSFLEGGGVEITAGFPAGRIGTTQENLLSAAKGEHEEHAVLYPAFAETAREEGFKHIAAVWDAVSVSEKYHEERYRVLLEAISLNQVFSRDEAQIWKCGNCGYIHEGQKALERCPACAHAQAYFEILRGLSRP